MMRRQGDSRPKVKQVNDVTMVSFTTSTVLGEGPCEATGKQLFSQVDNGGCRNLVLDFTGVERLDSAFVAKLITLHKRVTAAGGRLALCNLNPGLAEVFKTLQLHRLLKIYGEQQEALLSLQPSAG